MPYSASGYWTPDRRFRSFRGAFARGVLRQRFADVGADDIEAMFERVSWVLAIWGLMGFTDFGRATVETICGPNLISTLATNEAVFNALPILNPGVLFQTLRFGGVQ